jgi:hypothetical protein
MQPVKAEPPDPPAREKQKSKKARIAAEPGILDRVGATLGLCDRNLTAEEKEERVKLFCEQSREPADAARKYLTMCAYDVPKAMYTWALCLNAIDISSDVDDMATENEQPNGQSSSSRRGAHGNVAPEPTSRPRLPQRRAASLNAKPGILETDSCCCTPSFP